MGKYFDDLSYRVSYYEEGTSFFGPLAALGGTLYINDETIIFRPHSFNFGDKRDRVICIQNISGYKKKFGWLNIFLNNGKTIWLAVKNRDSAINQIESRRQSIYGRFEQQAPSLTINPFYKLV